MDNYKNTIFDIDHVLSLKELAQRGLTDEEKERWLVGYNKIRKTNGLFIDMNTEDRTSDFVAVYTLQDSKPLHYKNYNGMVRYDLGQLYLACGDITEVDFINKFLYDTHQWEKMQGNQVINKYITNWRKEQRLQVKSQMFSVLLEDALDTSSKTKTSSAKYLLEKYYDPVTKNNKQPKVDRDKDKHELMIINEDRERILKGLN